MAAEELGKFPNEKKKVETASLKGNEESKKKRDSVSTSSTEFGDAQKTLSEIGEELHEKFQAQGRHLRGAKRFRSFF